MNNLQKSIRLIQRSDGKYQAEHDGSPEMQAMAAILVDVANSLERNTQGAA